MTTARKPAANDLMLIVGQLLEATKAASDGLKSMSAEVQSNAKAIIAAVKTLEKVEETVAELDEIIRDSTNQGNLVGVTQGHTVQITGLHAAVGELKKTLDDLKEQMGTLDNNHAKIFSAKAAIWEVAKILGWIVTTGIAVYAALNGK